MFENIGHGLGSSSRSGRNRGAAAEADANGEQQLKWTQAVSSATIIEQQLKRRVHAAAEADAIGECGAAAEVDAIGEHSSAQRAVRRRITHVGERGGSS